MVRFTPSERWALVVLLLLGARLPADIADATGHHPRSISRALRGRGDRPGLVDRQLVVEVGRSTYDLTPQGWAEARRLLRNWDLFTESSED